MGKTLAQNEDLLRLAQPVFYSDSLAAAIAEISTHDSNCTQRPQVDDNGGIPCL
ncbi:MULTISPECIES: hypothetical protein [unclassified Nostoc]|uniref:hypothetical protein n=1 Tax=unclassified Nostoc TaxID=2593658 RepID=UPI002AD274EE|nr:MULTISPECIES: hypothetical protein [unclassified Nostoc]MDZ8090975.1 hypothetical protein [Nostoc sp. DedQUE05]MDZ8131146.1 hypothetical protein [Nostoc sp. DedQUE07]